MSTRAGTNAVAEEVVDMRGADWSIESLAAGGLGQSSPKLIYGNFIGTI